LGGSGDFRVGGGTEDENCSTSRTGEDRGEEQDEGSHDDNDGDERKEDEEAAKATRNGDIFSNRK